MASSKRLIMFDIGGVLVNFSENRYIRYLHKEILPTIPYGKLERFILPLIPLMDFDALDVPGLERMVAKHFGITGLDLGWVQGYMATARPYKSVIRLFNEISSSHRTVLLSNISRSRYAEIHRTYLKGIHPERVFLSYEMVMRKPDPNIYKAVLKETGVKPKNALFIDNMIENVIGAESVGVDSIWFRNYGQLVEELKSFGVLS